MVTVYTNVFWTTNVFYLNVFYLFYLYLYCLLYNLISVNIDASEIPRKKAREEKEANVPQKQKGKKEEKATDDYHYEKFKKQYRRYWIFFTSSYYLHEISFLRSI